MLTGRWNFSREDRGAPERQVKVKAASARRTPGVPGYFIWRFALAAALTILVSARSAPASADELVKFDAVVPRSGQSAQQGAGGAETGTDNPGTLIQGYLTKPRGRGPFPAVVLLHSCLGLPPDRSAIGSMIAGWGYVALFVDDFATRGLKQTCTVDFPEGVADAYGALGYVASLPFVDRARIAALGYSQGADTALTIASGRFAPATRGAKFEAAAAFYPPCANQGNARLIMPTLIIVGEGDDVTPAADCARLANAQPRRAAKVKLIVLPGADHAFDNPDFAGGAKAYGMWLKYDRGAAERAKAELRDFLAAAFARAERSGSGSSPAGPRSGTSAAEGDRAKHGGGG